MEWVSYICLCCDQDWDGDGDDGGYDDGWMDGWMDHPLPILINLDVKKWKMEDGRWKICHD